MKAKAQARAEPDKTSATTTDQTSVKRRDPAFGIVVVVIAAAFIWPILVGLYLYFSR